MSPLFTVTLQSGDAAAQVRASCLPIVRYASARLTIDALRLVREITVDIADATQADERTITLIANQPQQLITGYWRGIIIRSICSLRGD